jgi:hypothetical protein
LVETLSPTCTPTIPLHIPSELVYADIRRTAVRARNLVSYATDFVWDSLLPSAPVIADPPSDHRLARVSEILQGVTGTVTRTSTAALPSRLEPDWWRYSTSTAKGGGGGDPGIGRLGDWPAIGDPVLGWPPRGDPDWKWPAAGDPVQNARGDPALGWPPGGDPGWKWPPRGDPVETAASHPVLGWPPGGDPVRTATGHPALGRPAVGDPDWKWPAAGDPVPWPKGIEFPMSGGRGRQVGSSRI